jgi:hypothetical protein
VGGCALVLVVVLVLVLSGGGGGGGELVSGSALAQAARATERVPGATVSIDQVVTGGPLPKPMDAHLHGIQNTRQQAADIVGAYRNFPGKVPGQRADGAIPVEVVLIAPHMYLRSPLFARGLPAGKSWRHVDLVKVGRKLGIGDPTQFDTNDPTRGVGALRAISSRVERVGSESVRGVVTTHYRSTVELRKLPAVVPPSKRADARRSIERLIQLSGTDSYPMEVWIDRHHLVRRMRFVLEMKIQGQSLKYVTTTEMYDFGPKQKIKPPPAGDVYDVTKLVRRASAGGP